MDMKAFEYINAIAKHKSISKAAESLYISQPALSKYITKLEDVLGVYLIERGSGTTDTKLTSAGEIFLDRGNHILGLYNSLRNEISQGYAGRIHFGISSFYSKYYLPSLLPPFSRRFPHARFTIAETHTSELERLMLSGKLDLCLLPVYTIKDTLSYHFLREEEILLSLPQDSALKPLLVPGEDFPFMDLALCRDSSFVFLAPYQKFHRFGRQLCEQAGFSPKIACEVMDWQTLNTLIAKGLGIGFVPDVLLLEAPSIYERNIFCRFFPDQKISRPFAVVTSKTVPLSAIVNEFKKFIIDTAITPFS